MAKKERKKRNFNPPKWCICTEGVTEALYLKAYCVELDIKHLVDINSERSGCIRKKGEACGRQHRPLIDQAQICNKKSGYERMFIVHDLDDDGNPETIKSFDESFEMGEAVGISVYYSIPSFEYWLLLCNNLVDSDLTRTVCSDKVKVHVNAKCKEKDAPPLRNDTYKTEPALFDYFDGISGAIRAKENAIKIWSSRSLSGPPKKPSTVKPSTNFYLLLDELKTFSDKQK